MSDEQTAPDDALLAAGRAAMRALPDAPAAWLRRAEAIWPATGIVDLVRAVLSLDSWADVLPAVRAGGSPSRQLLFTTNARDVDVRIVQDAQGWTLEGQVLGPTEGGSLDVLSDGMPVHFIEFDDIGAFHIEGVVAGRYDVVLDFPDERMLLSLDIGFPAGR